MPVIDQCMSAWRAVDLKSLLGNQLHNASSVTITGSDLLFLMQSEEYLPRTCGA